MQSKPRVVMLSFRLERKMLCLKHQQAELFARMKVSWPQCHGPRSPPKGEDIRDALDSESTIVVYINKYPVYFGSDTVVLSSLEGSASTKKALAAVRRVNSGRGTHERSGDGKQRKKKKGLSANALGNRNSTHIFGGVKWSRVHSISPVEEHRTHYMGSCMGPLFHARPHPAAGTMTGK